MHRLLHYKNSVWHTQENFDDEMRHILHKSYNPNNGQIKAPRMILYLRQIPQAA